MFYWLSNSNKKAFTLAEVLITLGIIGVVAALTLPTLMANIKAIENANRLKKMMSAMNNGVKLSKAKYDIDFSNIDAYCNANSANDNPNERHSACAIMNGILSNAKYYYGTDDLIMKDGQPYKISASYVTGLPSMINFSKNPTYVLSDGSIIMFSSSLGQQPCTGTDIKSATRKSNGHGTACYGLIDVNGVNGPNKEVKCSKGKNNQYEGGKPETENCVVYNNDVNDVYPFAVFDDRVELTTSAGVYVLTKK